MLARMREVLLTTLLMTVASVLAREQTLFTSSVTYCEPPESLLVQQFDVTYFSSNQSIFFNVSAASVVQNVEVSANLLLNVYGIKPVNVTINLCDILGGALCPLPTYNFVGSDTLSLPDLGVDVGNKIPGIAYVVPDLEGYAQLVLTEVGTGDVKACVQATLSNGWSMYQTSVSWAVAGVAIAAVGPAAWQSLAPTALLPFRLLDLLHLYQSIAASAFLNLNYPLAYRSYARNFAWSLGLIRSETIQQSIDTMRHHTGGHMANSSDASAIEFTNRGLSPYNDNSANTLTRRGAKDADPATVATVTSNSANILDAGIPTYVNTLNIASANAFMTIFLCFLCFWAIVLAIYALIFVGILAYSRKNQNRGAELRARYPAYVRGWSLRLALITVPPVLIFAFFQWTLKDSWVSVLLSVVTFIVALGGLGFASFVVMREAGRSGKDTLFSRPEVLAAYGPLYAQFRQSRYFFFGFQLAAFVVRALFLSFGHGSGLAQIIGLLVVELTLVVSTLVFRPNHTRGADVFMSFLAIIRLVCTGLLIPFLERLGIQPIPRVVIGMVMAVVFSVTVLIVILNLIIHSGISRLWRRRKDSPDNTLHNSTVEDMVEKKKSDSPPTQYNAYDVETADGHSSYHRHSTSPSMHSPEPSSPLSPLDSSRPPRR
ncbi:TRP-domain-containing protein [Cylindrobasidium torrendii FP15055 ss-10]|uniref:TRP-domain-containing protein n=1 Tax=Cylindrobasidium torrendii FP15055 ss-10 TaxID=1314674 RepID=A0A0D7BUW5_9AGAR|nr:TRP-domain-containing protein [Cylindrobasidium torrendii FP15055 ss-10]